MNTPENRRRILRLPEVRERTGKPTSSIYALVSRGEFPAPIPLGPRAVGWLEEEVSAWVEARIAERVAKRKGTAA
jgi:prophage regulatory protein